MYDEAESEVEAVAEAKVCDVLALEQSANKRADNENTSDRSQASVHAVEANAADVPIDPMESEALALNLEASIRIFNDHHFFGWTQGLLQNLVRHEVLVCVRRKGENAFAPVDCYATAAGLQEWVSQQIGRETGFLERLIRDWQSKRFRPQCHELDDDGEVAVGTGSSTGGSASVVRGLIAAGNTRLITHGTYDDNGRMSSFFIFAGRPDDTGPRQAYLAELIVPFLHTAWVRTKVRLNAETSNAGTTTPARDLLTQREREVLKWVCLGKSNIEIGMILGISSLTVKNHVQEILRRLNVQNRAQAVGKAFDLHILNA